jgi:phage shock protein A
VVTALKRWWAALAAKLRSVVIRRTDPDIELANAIAEAEDQDRRLREQATRAEADQQQREARLVAAQQELEKVSGYVRDAAALADEAAAAGASVRVAEHAAAAESFATRLIAMEGDGELHTPQALRAVEASDRASAAVEQHAAVLRRLRSEQAERRAGPDEQGRT